MTANHRRDLLDEITDLKRRMKSLEGRVATPAVATMCTSATRPANPQPGQEIFETDTGATAVYSGSAWLRAVTEIGSTILPFSSATITIPVPAGFTHIKGIFTARQDTGSGGAYCFLRFNGDTGSSYIHQEVVGQISSAVAQNSGGAVNGLRVGVAPGSGDTANYFGSGEFIIGNVGGGTFKPVSSQFVGAVSATNAYAGVYGGLWLSTAAITSVTLVPGAGNLVSGSCLSLYGLM